MNRRRALIGSLWASCAGLVAPKLAAQTPQKNADSDLEPVGKLKTVPTQDKRPARPKTDGAAAEPRPEPPAGPAGAVRRCCCRRL